MRGGHKITQTEARKGAALPELKRPDRPSCIGRQGQFLHGEREKTMFCGNNNGGSLWIIIIIILLFGNGYGCGCNNGCGNNNGCGCGCN